MEKKTIFRIFILLWLTQFGISMTVKQIKQAGKTMRGICQPKNNVTNELIDNIHNGEFIDDRNVKCYIACVLKMANTMKNGKLNFESANKQIDMLLPEEMKAPAKAVLVACRSVPDGYKDICDASFHVCQCIYKENPSIFLFP